jgi:hypothetical protein
MNPNTILGVLTDTHFILIGTSGGKRAPQSIPLPPQVSDRSTLFRHAVQAGLTSLWVMPGTRFSREVSRFFIEQTDNVWEVVATPGQLDPACPLCASVWRKLPSGRQGPILSLTFPEYGGWGWQLPDAMTLFATVTYLEHALGVPVSCSPEQLALDVLKDLTVTTDASWVRPPTVDLRTLPTGDGQIVPIQESARPVVWMRPLTIAEWRMKYLHKYEHNTLDLEACKEVLLGAGDPLYSANGRAYDGKLPGIWRVKAETAGSIFDGKRLPSCIHGEWMSTPEVKCCAAIAYQVQVTEGYYWPESHRTLERWATTLQKALQRFKQLNNTYRHAPARSNASHTIQAIAQLGIEKLADFAPLADKQEKTPSGLYRPDWWAQITGQSRASVFAHLVTLVGRGSMPILVDRHTLWFVSNDPNPLTAVPGLAPEKPGGYKAAYEAPLTLSSEIKEAFRTSNNATQLALMLDALAKEKIA